MSNVRAAAPDVPHQGGAAPNKDPWVLWWALVLLGFTLVPVTGTDAINMIGTLAVISGAVGKILGSTTEPKDMDTNLTDDVVDAVTDNSEVLQTATHCSAYSRPVAKTSRATAKTSYRWMMVSLMCILWCHQMPVVDACTASTCCNIAIPKLDPATTTKITSSVCNQGENACWF